MKELEVYKPFTLGAELDLSMDIRLRFCGRG